MCTRHRLTKKTISRKRFLRTKNIKVDTIKHFFFNTFVPTPHMELRSGFVIGNTKPPIRSYQKEITASVKRINKHIAGKQVHAASLVINALNSTFIIIMFDTLFFSPRSPNSFESASLWAALLRALLRRHLKVEFEMDGLRSGVAGSAFRKPAWKYPLLQCQQLLSLLRKLLLKQKAKQRRRGMFCWLYTINSSDIRYV